MTISTNLNEAIDQVSDLLEEKMARLLAVANPDGHTVLPFASTDKVAASIVGTTNDDADTVMQAMRYSALSGGKRLRPFLTIASGRLFGVSEDAGLYAAAALEFIHTYSLIHDDLPAMDDDALRRGKPSCHVQFGEAAAILAGDALLTYAFEILADNKVHPDPQVRCELVRTVARAAGHHGMVGGQMMDMEGENADLTVDEIIRLQRLKTGEMFAVSCEAAAILGKAPNRQRSILRAYAHDIGLAFQITDDLLDVQGTRKKVGKEVNKDKIAGKATLVGVMGVEEARDHADFLVTQAISHLKHFDHKADLLRDLARFIITREN